MKARLASLAGAVCAGVSLLPAAALACGGFFCNTAPVDQQAERIIFVQEDSNIVTSYVEIAYQGEPEGFAWVVPVPSVPALDVWHGGAFNALDLLTEPQFDIPWGCFAEAGADADADGAPNDDRGEVEVLDQRRVGPFDTATIESDDPRALVEWLRLNEYRITPAMEPFIAMYTREGLKFLAMKLAPGEGTDAIQPIKMTYNAISPMVPLRLTSVAAQLEMGVKVWVLGTSRYGAAGLPDVVIDDADLRFDPNTWQTNYLALVARKVDGNGGKGFITEFAGQTAPLAQQVRDSFVPEWAGQEAVDARDALAELLASRPYVTRLYTRLSPEEMDHDPAFVAVGGGDVSNRHAIPAPADADVCGGPAAEDVDACDFAACGAGGACAAVDRGQWAHGGGVCLRGGHVGAGGAGSEWQSLGGLRRCAAQLHRAGARCGAGGLCRCLRAGGFLRGRGRVRDAQRVSELPVQCRVCGGADGRRAGHGGRDVCHAPAIPLDARVVAAIELREPNLPYPGRVTELADPSQPVEDRRGGGAPSAWGGCSMASPGAPAWPAWLLALPVLGLALRRRR
jgi:hypothetical protein